MRSNFWGVKQANPLPGLTRSSIAFLDGVQYAANAARKKTMALVSTSDGAIRTGEGTLGTEKHLDNAAAVDKGAGLVGIPLTSHGFSAATCVRIYDTVNYNGDFQIISVTTHEFVIKATYAAETFAGTEHARIVPYIRPCGHNGTYLFGIDNSSSRLYSSLDGVTWSYAGLYSTAIVGSLVALDSGTLMGAISGGRTSPGVTPADITPTSTSVADGSSDALLTKTGAFTSGTRPTGSIAYFVFPAACPVASGFYTITRISDNTAKITPMGGTDEITWAQFGSVTTTWWAQDAYYNGTDTCYGSSGTGGKLQINKTSGFSTLFANGTRIWVAFANTNSKYTTGYYKYERVSDNACFLINETTGAYVMYDAAADNQYCAFCIGQGFIRSTDNGVTFATVDFRPECKLTSETFPAVNVTPWAFLKHGSTIICGEYGACTEVGVARYLHRSVDDGLTWTAVFDLRTLTPNMGRHFHSVGYHAATGKWIASVGDIAYAAILTSADDGLTWQLVYGTGNCVTQPICFVDTGDPESILASCDTEDCAAWINMNTGRASPAFNKTARFSAQFYAFTINKYGDLYYAGGYDPNTTYTGITVSTITVSTKTIVVASDRRHMIKPGMIIKLSGTVAADGFYTVASVSFSTTTSIVVSEAIPGSNDTTGTVVVSYDHSPCLWVSKDCINWSVYHKFQLSEESMGFGGWYAGYAGGKLHYCIQVHARTNPSTPTETSAYRHFAISPASWKKVIGTLITPAGTNLLDTEDKSSFSSAVNLTALSGTTCAIERDSSVAYHGNWSNRVVLSGLTAGSFYVRSPDFSLTAGVTYTASFAVRSDKPVQLYADLYAGSGDGTQHGGGYLQSQFMCYPTWQRHFTMAWVPTSTASNFKIVFRIVKFTDPVTVWFDALDVKAAPIGEFQVGGTAKTADVLAETITTEAAWTDIFAIQTLGQHWHYQAAANLYIKTWYVGSNVLSLYYNVTNKKFYIQRNSETAVASLAQEWHPNQIIKFALRADASGLTLDIQNGKAKEQITDSALAALLTADMSIVYGDSSSANQFSGIVFDGSMDEANECGFGIIPFKLTDFQITKAFNLAPIVKPVVISME